MTAWVTGVTPAPCLGATANSRALNLPFIYQDWETYTTQEGLPYESVRDIRVANGRVWVGTDGGLALFDDGRWKTWMLADSAADVPHPIISAIDIDERTEDVWLGTLESGLFRLTAGRVDHFDQINSGLAGNLVFDLVVAYGRVWVATNGGISSFDPIGGEWQLYFERRADASNPPIMGLTPDRGGAGLYAAPWGGALRRIDLARGTLGTVGGGVLPRDGAADTTSFVDLADGTLWLATQTGLLRRNGPGKWAVRKIGGQRLNGEFIHSLAARSQTEVWLGTDRGLAVLADWQSDTWVTYRRCDADPQTQVTVLQNGEVLRSRPLRSTFPANRIRCVAFDGDEVWVGTSRGLARAVGNGRWAGLRPGVPDEDPAERSAACPATQSALEHPLADAPSPPARPVAIGVLSSSNRTMLLPSPNPQSPEGAGRMDLPAVQLAVKQANARGGYRGTVPFEVLFDLHGYARYGWTLPEDDFVTMASMSRVLGVVGYVGPGNQFAAAAAARAEVPVVNAAPLPAAAGEAVHPWIFRLPGGEPGRQKRLLDAIFDELGDTRLAIMRTPGSAGQAQLDLWARLACERERPVVGDIQYDPKADELGPLLAALQRSRAEVVLTWCEVDVAAAILRAMREAGMTQLFVGGRHIVTDRFVELVGCDPGRVIALWGGPEAAVSSAEAHFRASYQQRFKRPPSAEAFHSYSAATHLLRAIGLAGRERDAIRSTLDAMEHAFMAQLESGRWTFRTSAGQP